ncbi:MAG: nucleoside hydrolase-like domain-containing protein [Terricaulis sp.]
MHILLAAARFVCIALIACAALAASPASAQEKPRVFVLTDIGNEPDDAESLVRFLLYANAFDIEGIAATTSRWQRDSVRPDLIAERVEAYGRVLPNLRVHAEGYPSARALERRIVQGRAAFGMAGVGDGKDTPASNALIAAVDRADTRPVWVLVWGGAVELAQALWHVRATRSPEEVARFVAKLRVYSISDQDDAGPWVRHEFREIWWIVSLHAYSQYARATWSGISGEGLYGFDPGGPDSTLVSNEWLETHVRRGPLGALYPPWRYIMEGDTPSFLHLIPNGLNAPEHPNYGGWGGRYGRVSAHDTIFTDSIDAVTGANGALFHSAQASIWRWREAYQNDFAARIAWSTTRRFADANHNPIVLLNQSADQEPLVIDAAPGAAIMLDAAGSRDPDGDALSYRWLQYAEAGGPDAASEARITAEAPGRARIDLPDAAGDYHFILEVHDDAPLPLFAYRRAIVRVANH